MEEQRDAAVHHTNALRILGKLLDKGTVDRLSLALTAAALQLVYLRLALVVLEVIF